MHLRIRAKVGPVLHEVPDDHVLVHTCNNAFMCSKLEVLVPTLMQYYDADADLYCVSIFGISLSYDYIYICLTD